MSVKLLETDYMSVVWEYTKKEVWDSVSESWDSAILNKEYLKLYFTVQVNWKLKVSQHYLELIRDKILKETEEHSNLSIKQCDARYAIRNLFSDLWYPLWNRADNIDPLDSSVINWIDKCYKVFKNKNEFYF